MEGQRDYHIDATDLFALDGPHGGGIALTDGGESTGHLPSLRVESF